MRRVGINSERLREAKGDGSHLVEPQFAGFTVAQGSLNMVNVFIWSVLGSVIGAYVLYGVGAWLGLERLRKIADWMWLVRASDVDAAMRERQRPPAPLTRAIADCDVVQGSDGDAVVLTLFHAMYDAYSLRLLVDDLRALTLGKAGAARWRGVKPTVRGAAMNPVDHPHGGGEANAGQGNPHPVTPWGVPTKGYKTRKNKRTQQFIVRDRRS